MGGYLSFDASVKIHKSGRYTSTKTKKSGAGGIYGYFRHVDRKTDKLNGCEVQHSNEMILSILLYTFFSRMFDLCSIL